jgi:hypothetical protein
LLRLISSSGNIHYFAILSDVAGSFGLVGQEKRGLGGALQRGNDTGKFGIKRSYGFSLHWFSP